MLLNLKGVDGDIVILNTDHIVCIGKAMDQNKAVLLNASAAVMIGGQVMLLKGTAAEIAELIQTKRGVDLVRPQ